MANLSNQYARILNYKANLCQLNDTVVTNLLTEAKVLYGEQENPNTIRTPFKNKPRKILAENWQPENNLFHLLQNKVVPSPRSKKKGNR